MFFLLTDGYFEIYFRWLKFFWTQPEAAKVYKLAFREVEGQPIAAYRDVQKNNNSSEFIKAALNPERGLSAKAAGELLVNLRKDWELIQDQFTILSAGDEKNFDLRVLLLTQNRMVEKVERLTAALVRYANLTYGS